MDYKDIDSPDSESENMGGVKTRFYFAPLRYFDEIKTVDPAGTTLASRVEISQSHTFKSGLGFHSYYITLDKGGLNVDMQGERDARSRKTVFKAFTPGSDLDLHGAMDIAKNEPCIVLVEESDGKLAQVGTKDYPAEIPNKYSTGETTGGYRGYEIEVNSVSARNYRYTGSIVLWSVESGS